MALVVEDGTGLANAESYISVAAASARHTSLGNLAWATAASDTIREQALRRAAAYMEQAYRERWRGTRLLRAQALSWPRYGAMADGYPIDSNIVPADVAAVNADLALRALSDDLNADLERGVLRKKLGPIEKEFDPYSPQQKRYRAIDMALAPYLKGAGASVSLVRA